MSGKTKIAEGLKQTEVGQKPGFDERLTAAERRISEALVAGGEARDLANEASERIGSIERQNERQRASSRKASSIERRTVLFTAVFSVGVLTYVNALGYVAVPLLAAFTPAIAVILTYFVGRWLLDHAAPFFRLTFGACVICAAMVPLAVATICGAITYLLFRVVKPLRALGPIFMKRWRDAWGRISPKGEAVKPTA